MLAASGTPDPDVHDVVARDAGVIASMNKSVALLAAASMVCGLAAAVAWGLGGIPALSMGLAASLVLSAVALALLAIGGLEVVRRQRRLQAGEADLFLVRNAVRSEAALRRSAVPQARPLRRWLARSAFGHRHLVGDRVRVKSIEAIRATLDANHCLDGLPFMEEMAAFCGRTARVFRVVDKIYDYGRSRMMRRLDGCVLLVGLRCDGSDHGGCEAACYLIWKTQWLDALEPGAAADDGLAPLARPRAMRQPPYHCQYTELSAASRPAAASSIHGTLGPLVVGNITAAAFGTALVTRAFNAFQSWRGGVCYPSAGAADGQPAPVSEPVQAGDWVRIRLSHEIARTLDKNSKHRGLWFDADMLKFCGQTFRVRGRVQQIIDVSRNAMVSMKTPCITLDDVHYSGEFQGFGEQHDYLYWREAWLQRVGPPPGRD